MRRRYCNAYNFALGGGGNLHLCAIFVKLGGNPYISVDINVTLETPRGTNHLNSAPDFSPYAPTRPARFREMESRRYPQSWLRREVYAPMRKP